MARLASGALLAVVICLTTSGVAFATQTSAQQQLERLILDRAPAGFAIAPSEGLIKNGPLKPDEITDLSGLVGEDLAGKAGHARTWRSRDEGLLVVLLFRASSIAEAVRLDLGLTSSLAAFPGSVRFEVEGFDHAVGYTVDDVQGSFFAQTVTFRRGVHVAQVILEAQERKYAPSEVVDVAVQQAGRIPGPAMNVPGPPRSFSADLVRLSLFAVPLLAAAAILTVRSVSRRSFMSDPSEDFEDPASMRSLRQRGNIAIFMLTVSVLIAGAAAVAWTARAGLLTQLRDQGQIVVADGEASDRMVLALAVTQLAMFLATGIAWLRWQHRGHSNLMLFRSARELRFTPGWAVGWWFVPIMSVFRPYQAMKELSLMSSPAERAKAAAPDRLLRWWWAFFLTPLVLDEVPRLMTDSLEVSIAGSYLQTAMQGARVVAGCLAILVVVGVVARQGATWRLVGDSGRADPAGPPPLPHMRAPDLIP